MLREKEKLGRRERKIKRGIEEREREGGENGKIRNKEEKQICYGGT